VVGRLRAAGAVARGDRVAERVLAAAGDSSVVLAAEGVEGRGAGCGRLLFARVGVGDDGSAPPPIAAVGRRASGDGSDDPAVGTSPRPTITMITAPTSAIAPAPASSRAPSNDR
jgi:hypothetical protein